MKTMKNYHDHYLLSDVILLADVKISVIRFTNNNISTPSTL